VNRRALLVAGALLLSAACNAIVGNSDGVYVQTPGADAGPDALLEGYTLAVVSGEAQSGEVGEQLAQPLVVEARDPRGNPAVGIPLRFVASQGGGYFVDSTGPVVDGSGRAQVRYVLGPAENNVVDVSVEGTTAKASLRATSKHPWQVSIYAGQRVGRMIRDGKGTDARLLQPRGVAVATDGQVFIADEYGNAIRRYDPITTEVVTHAGKLGQSGRVEGIGGAARFTGPQALALEQAGRLLVGGWGTHSIHRVDIASSEVTFLVGSGLSGSKDDIGTRAQFQNPRGVAVDNVGQRAFVADKNNNLIRLVNLATGEVKTLAGSAGVRGAVDGPGDVARFRAPMDVAFDGDKTLFITDNANEAIRALDLTTNEVRTFAGKMGAQAYVDGPASTARFMGPHYLTYDAAHRMLYVTDLVSSSIRCIAVPVTGEPQVTTVVGPVPPTIVKDAVDGTGSDARVFTPAGLALTPDGKTLYFADASATLRRMDVATRAVTTVVGTSALPKNGDALTEAVFDWPRGLAADKGGGVLALEAIGNAVRRIAGGTVTRLAGPQDETAGETNGAAADARFNKLVAAVSDDTYVYVAQGVHTIRRVSMSDGTTTTLAGAYDSSDFKDGPGATARFNTPVGMAVDPAARELYIADSANNRIRAIDLDDPSFTVSTRAGGSVGATDGNAASARFNAPAGLALGNGVLYVADTRNHAIRAIELQSGNVTTVAGALEKSGFEDGTGDKARFNSPYQLALDGDLLYVTDLSNAAIRRVHLPSRTVSTFLGGIGAGFGTGALPIALNQPHALLVRPGGEVIFSQRYENVLLRLGP